MHARRAAALRVLSALIDSFAEWREFEAVVLLCSPHDAKRHLHHEQSSTHRKPTMHGRRRHDHQERVSGPPPPFANGGGLILGRGYFGTAAASTNLVWALNLAKFYKLQYKRL